MSTLFTKIITGEIPSHKVYEDDKTFAFLDIYPITEGHVLVIPKVECDRFEDLSDADYQAVWQTVRRVAKRLREVYGDKRVCLKVEGFDVPHAHIHVFACHNAEDFYRQADRSREPDHEALAIVAQKIAFS
ncbi:MAG TPA: HIT family protein [Candidatus Saccharimonadales bacterium]|nr:HIT family protein [Candidatus Saccharimonadales bacterium]